jgi:hypothetical protein
VNADGTVDGQANKDPFRETGTQAEVPSGSFFKLDMTHIQPSERLWTITSTVPDPSGAG